jgi:hypothetical protein
VFAPDKPFLPSLIFASKTGPYPGGAAEILDQAGKAGQGQTFHLISAGKYRSLLKLSTPERWSRIRQALILTLYLAGMAKHSSLFEE